MKTLSQQAGDFLARVQWRNVAALVSVLLMAVAIVWVIIDGDAWPRCLIFVGCAYPMALLSLERPL